MRKNDAKDVRRQARRGNAMVGIGAVSVIALLAAMTAVKATPREQIAPRFVERTTLPPKRDARLLAPPAGAPTYMIPAGDLASALTLWADTSGLKLLAQSGALKGLKTPGLFGARTPEAALGMLLSGTDLVWRWSDASTIAITSAAYAQLSSAGEPTIALDTIEVQGQKPNAVVGAPPILYAGRQVGSGTRVGLLGNRSVFDTPFNVTGYTDKLIQDQQARTIADVAANDPSVRSLLPRNSFSDQFFIRGFGLFPFDMSFDGLYGIVDIRRPAIEGIARVEILKGPSTFLNGIPPIGSGIGGQFTLIPKRATDEPITQVTTSLFSKSEVGTHIDLGRRFGPNKEWGVRFNGAYRGGASAVDRSSIEFGTMSLGLDYRGDRLRLSADLGYQDEKVDGVTQQRNVATGFAIPRAPDGRINVGQPWEYFDHKNAYAAFRAEYDIAPDVTVYAAYGTNRYSERSLIGAQQITNGFGDTLQTVNAGGGVYNNQTVDIGVRAKVQTGPLTHQLSLSGVIVDRPFDNYSLTAATGIRSNIYNPRFVQRPFFVEPDLRRSSLATTKSLALADTISAFDERVMLTLGGRVQQIEAVSYDRNGATTSRYEETKVTPSVGLVIKPLKGLSLYGNYIEALQQGDSAPTTAINAGEVFAPYVAKQYEIGAKYDFGGFGVGLAAFDIEQPSAFTDPATRRFSVDGLQRNRGIELTVFGEPVQGFRLLGGVTFLDGKLEQTAGDVNNGKTAPGVPDVQANLSGEYDLPFVKGLTATGRVIYTSSQMYDAANTQSIPEWVRFDAGLRYTFEREPGKPVTLRASVENIADRKYWAATGRGFLTPGAPRTYLMSATFDF